MKKKKVKFENIINGFTKVKGYIVTAIICLSLIGVFHYISKITINCYNDIVKSWQEVKNSVGSLEAEYQRRYAIIDNLVSLCKQYKEFEIYLVQIEKEIYEKTALAKATATKMDVSAPDTINKRTKSENALGSMLTNALDKLMVLAQKFPEIKDPQPKDRLEFFNSLSSLRNTLINTEDRILTARKNMNEYIKSYNQFITIFPANLVAGQFRFESYPYFEAIDEKAKENVKISF